MARPKKASPKRKSRVVSFRLEEDVRDRLQVRAASAGVTLTDLITTSLANKAEPRGAQSNEETTAAPELLIMSPELFNELRRIGNNVNQIAHAVNAGLPPYVQDAYRNAARLLDLLLADELSVRHTALRMRNAAHGAAHSQTGNELQRGVRVYSARPRQENS